MDLLSYSIECRIKKSSVISKLEELIDWSKIKKELIKLKTFETRKSAQGRKGYDPLSMFKAILLGQWYSLSDRELEEALNIRLDFIRFTGLGLNEEVPDETTLCRFRNRLIQQGSMDVLLNGINQELENRNLKINKSHGAIVDATIIDSSAKPRKVIGVEEPEGSLNIEYSKDPEARWLKKGSKSYFGYRAYVRCEDNDGYIEKLSVYPANEYEAHKLEELVIDLPESTRIYADKGFSSKENRKMLRSKKLKDGLMHKAKKSKSLKRLEKIKNKLISQLRYKIEQCFGTLKRKFSCTRALYLGCKGLEGQLYLKAMCMNLLKACNKAFV